MTFFVPPDAPPHKLLRATLEDGSEGGAILSPCEVYRYALWRIWDVLEPVWLFGMLNPSKALHNVGDPTVDRQVERSRRGGAGGTIVVNSGALRETDRLKAIRHADPIGPDNLYWVRLAIRQAQVRILAHGPDAVKFGGDRLFRTAFDGVATSALKITKDGWPGHPLYLGYATPLLPYAYGDHHAYS